ncbi:unnamed protein product [Periconia digitata]|uniref:Uncharacterized protein n=1 Tax=Periconia digitata TaxID=1303443 RepID=A0A9W4XWJ6_9PLEO|nr:unnamed protein product [Periconia digitata]
MPPTLSKTDRLTEIRIIVVHPIPPRNAIKSARMPLHRPNHRELQKYMNNKERIRKEAARNDS